MIDLGKMAATLRKDWKCTAVLAAAFAFACWCSALQIRSEWGGSAALLILLACLLYQTAKAAKPAPAEKGVFPRYKILAWALIAVALALVFLPAVYPDAPGLKFCALFFLSLGALCLFCGARTMLLGAAPLLGCFLAVPFREQIVLYLSSPFRMASTVLSVGFLQMCGMKIENDMTTIRVEGLDIAITDACSGIQQFEAMILVAFWLVMAWRRPFVWRCIHYLFLIPSIILANAVRIILTIALYKAGFTAILNNAWHEGLGYAQVVLAVVLFFLVGCLLPEYEQPASSGEKNGAGNAKNAEKKKKTGKGARA